MSGRDLADLVALRKLIVDTAATPDVDGWSVEIDDETGDRIAEAILARLGGAR